MVRPQTATPKIPNNGRTPARRAAAVRAALVAVLATAALSAISSDAAAAAQPICERAMADAARANGVPLDILYSVGLTETGHKGVLGPYEMNVDGRSVHNETLAEALAAYERFDKAGAKFIDIGCMQINHHYHAAKFNSLQEMFDPERNVRYAAGLLKTLRAQEGSWTMAVARYNAGPNNPKAQRAYICAVISRMVESGVGAWTPNARAFCG